MYSKSRFRNRKKKIVRGPELDFVAVLVVRLMLGKRLHLGAASALRRTCSLWNSPMYRFCIRVAETMGCGAKRIDASIKSASMHDDMRLQ